MSKINNILIVGVGGQGSLLASRILGNIFLAQGLSVKVSEVHGMSQRGGSVVTYVRAGEDVASPLVLQGETDTIIAFEQLEAARWLPWLKKDGTMVMSSQKISPMPVITGAAVYPDNIVDTLTASGVKIVAIDALSLAKEAGSAKAANIVMLGAASKLIGFDEETWKQAMRAEIKPKFIEMNLKAFELGRNAVV